jgi:hypothetical protein
MHTKSLHAITQVREVKMSLLMFGSLKESQILANQAVWLPHKQLFYIAQRIRANDYNPFLYCRGTLRRELFAM